MRGLQVVDCGLWLGAAGGKGPVLLTELATPVRGRRQLLCSADLARALPAKRRVLALPWHRPITLGNTVVALSPAGSGWGAAAVRLGCGATTVVDLRQSRAAPMGGLLWEAPPQADVAVVDLAGAGEASAAWAEAVAAVAAGPADWAVDDAAVAAALAGDLRARGHPVALAASAARLLGRWQRAGFQAAAAEPSSGAAVRIHVATPPAAVPYGWLGAAPDGQAAVSVAFGRRAAGSAIAELVSLAGARIVLAVGDGGEAGRQMCARWLQRGIDVVHLRPQAQLPLPGMPA